ncbi:DNA N-6-adenine-methyltransferase [Furfurilactobacillus cerevisiae]|uniref:DNA N-6-adenine-methyltransferase n=1 Tax=Furfurilactobacillus rossiae TaxID=231049 RepID=UPI003B97F0EA
MNNKQKLPNDVQAADHNLSTLNDHLFDELDRLGDENLTEAEIVKETARTDNSKCVNFISPEQDSLSTNWANIKGNLFLNPPYGRDLRKWVKKAYESSLNHDGNIVLLIPSRTDTSYWHDFIFNKADIEFIRGRLKFEVNGVAGNPAPFPSALVIYKGDGGDD